MKRKINSLLGMICLFILFGCLFSLSASAAECSLTVQLNDPFRQPINGLSVSLHCVATVENGRYLPAESLAGSGISTDAIAADSSGEFAAQIQDYIREHGVLGQTATSEDGTVSFPALAMGIWLVSCPEGQPYTFDPFLVILPAQTDSSLDVVSAPKVSQNTPYDKTVYVVKRWDDENNGARRRPDKITVILKRNGAEYRREDLSAQTGWAYTFAGLPEEGSYTVEEVPVDRYTPSYNGDAENGFVITNTYSHDGDLPVTGQLWWPVVILAVAGVCFVLLGLIQLKGKKDENDPS